MSSSLSMWIFPCCSVTPKAPISRLEQAGPQPSQRQCPELRRVVFHSTRDTMLRARAATKALIIRLDFNSRLNFSYLSLVIKTQEGCVLLPPYHLCVMTYVLQPPRRQISFQLISVQVL